MLLSIPHTGAQFIRRVFHKCGERSNWAHIYEGRPRRLERTLTIPLRDPMACILSHMARYGHAKGVIDSYRWVMDAEAYFVPIDMPCNRRALILGALENEGVVMNAEKMAIMNAIVDEWTPVNTSRDTPEKEAYRRGETPYELDADDVADWMEGLGYPPFSWRTHYTRKSL